MLWPPGHPVSGDVYPLTTPPRPKKFFCFLNFTLEYSLINNVVYNQEVLWGFLNYYFWELPGGPVVRTPLTLTAEGPDSSPGRGTKIPQAA